MLGSGIRPNPSAWRLDELVGRSSLRALCGRRASVWELGLSRDSEALPATSTGAVPLSELISDFTSASLTDGNLNNAGFFSVEKDNRILLVVP